MDEALLTVSVVSHGHDAWLPALLAQLAATGKGRIAHVIVTHNQPPQPQVAASFARAWPFELTEIANREPAGFGANHNRAFEQARSPFFCVLNPDINLVEPDIWADLQRRAAEPGAGCAYPELLNPDGTVQDNARSVPTPWALFQRRVLGRRDAQVDWASAAFWVVPSEVYRRLGGFDEHYFMYCEDADFCLRLQLSGWRLVRSTARAVHDAQRSSHRQWQHLGWHLRSLLRLWTGAALRQYRRRSGGRAGGQG